MHTDPMRDLLDQF
jgi:serine/threonine protein kinase